LSPNEIQKLIEVDIRVAESAFQCVPIDFVMKREDYDTAIGVLHLHVTALSMHFNEA